MKNLLVLLVLSFVLIQVQSQTCNALTENLYNYKCVPKTCMPDLGRLGKVGPAATYPGRINPALYLDAQLQADGTTVKVGIYQMDEKANPLEKAACLNYVIYSTKGVYGGDTTRQFVDGNGKPTWPVQQASTFDDASSNTIRGFSIVAGDLPTKCVKQATNSIANQDKYYCFFEMSIELALISQAQYFMQIEIQVSQSTNAAVSTQFFPIVEIASVQACTLDNPQVCVLNPKSTVLFCKDSTCAATQATPFQLLILNQKFWLIQQITDAKFSSWKMSSNKVLATAPGTSIDITPVAANVVNSVNGQIIYALSVPIVMKQVSIQVQSSIALASARMLEQSFNLRVLQMSGDPLTIQKTQEIDCVRAKEGDSCATTTTPPPATNNTNTTNGGSSNSQRLILAAVLMMAAIAL